MVQYKKFKLNSLFDIQKVRGINKPGLTKPTANECYDYITRTSKNNGIESQTGPIKSRELNEANTFSLGLLQMTFFYRDRPWYAGQFVRKIVPKRPMTQEQMLYFLGIFQTLRPLLSSILVRKVDETFLNTAIELPVTPEEDLDFAYMTEYIRELEADRIRELEAYLAVTGLNDTTLSESEANALAKTGVCWKRFKIGDLFKKVDLKRKKASFIKAKDTSTVQTNEFDLPLINAKLGNNGIMYYGRSKDWMSIDLGIDVIQNGAVATGMVYAQPDKVGRMWDAYIIKWKRPDNLTPEHIMYMATCLRKSIRGKYNYQRKATWPRVQNDELQLPVTLDNHIDFEYMQDYIRATEKQVIKDVVAYKDRVIKETKRVVNG